MSERIQVLEQRINKLRSVINEKPTKYKPRSKLSHVLIEYSKLLDFDPATGKSECTKTREDIKLEAYEHAKKCIELAPTESIGYGALSISAPSFQERMDALKKAVEIEQSSSTTSLTSSSSSSALTSLPKAFGIAYAMHRLLIEPRHEESREISSDPIKKKKIPKGSSKHPSKRDLDSKEQLIYSQMRAILIEAEEYLNPSSIMIDQKSAIDDEKHDEYVSSQLGMMHYKVGLFFRKLQPETKHRSTSLYHLNKTLDLLPSKHATVPNCQFWIATFGNERDDIGSSTSKGISVDRCPEEYVVSLYSTFAANFDDLLVNKLKYQTPTKLRHVVDKVKKEMTTSHSLDALKQVQRPTVGVDLGCGTGLSGVAFQDNVDEFYGIDLSPEMIEKAKSRDCYKDLYIGELETIFCQPRLDSVMYDLIIACDVFVYIGELRHIFESIYEKLRPNVGLFAFSVECLEESNSDKNNKPFVLHKCARFGHKKSYIEKIATDTRFVVKHLETSVIRRNKGKDVTGLLVVLST